MPSTGLAWGLHGPWRPPPHTPLTSQETDKMGLPPLSRQKDRSLTQQVIPWSQSCRLQPTSALSLLPAPTARMVFKNTDQTGPDHTSNLPLLFATFTPPPKQSEAKSGPASLSSHKQPPMRDTPHCFPHLPAAPHLRQGWSPSPVWHQTQNCVPPTERSLTFDQSQVPST